MEKLPKSYRSVEEITLGSPENKKTEEFLFNNEQVNDHSYEQKKVIEISKDIIDNHLSELGIEQKFPFDVNRISYKIPGGIGTSYFGPNTDIVAINSLSEANLGTTIHELLHAYSSQFRNYDTDQAHENAVKNKKSISSGFHVNHYKDGYENKFTSINFSALNEAVTEKLARDLFIKNHDKIQGIKSLFEGKSEEIINRVNLRHEKNKEEIGRKIEEIKKKFNQKREIYFDDVAKNIDEARQEMINSNEYDKDTFARFEKSMQRSRDSFILMLHEFEKEEINITKFGADEKLHKSFLDSIKENYSFSVERESYQDNIEILELMLEGAAIKFSNNFDEIEDNKLLLWENLQRAYFNNKPMFLRVFDKIYNDSILRRFEELNYKMDDSNITMDEMKKELNHKNTELSVDLLQKQEK